MSNLTDMTAQMDLRQLAADLMRERDAAHAEIMRLRAARVELEHERDAALAAVERLKSSAPPQLFAMQRAPYVPWELVAPYEAQAQRNHGQTLAHIHARGGLTPGELWCAVHGRELGHLPPRDDAAAWFEEWRKQPIRAEVERLRAELAAATERDPETNTSVGLLRVQRYRLRQDLAAMTTERDAWQERAEGHRAAFDELAAIKREEMRALLDEVQAAGQDARPQVCGWCVQAAGGDQAAWDAAPRYTLDEVRAHTLSCPHNPLVVRAATAARDTALHIAEALRQLGHESIADELAGVAGAQRGKEADRG